MSGKSPTGLSKDPQSYEGANLILPTAGWRLVVGSRSPTSNDSKYPLGSIWVNKTNNTVWILTSFNPTNWTEFAASVAGAIIQLTGDSGGAILPAAGNINLLGTANQITSIGAGSTITFSLIGPYTPSTYTAHGVLVGEGTSSIVALAVGTNGQVLTGNSAADPSFAAIGTKSGLTAHGVVLAEGNSAFVATSAGTNGQLLIGGTADPAFATVTSSGGIAFTTGNNTLDIHTATGGFTVVNQNTSSANLAAQTMYITNNGASLVTYTLPATVAQGTVIKIVGTSAGGWKVAQNANGFINQGGQVTTVGTGGSISSTSKADSIELTAIDATTNAWIVSASNGATLTFV